MPEGPNSTYEDLLNLTDFKMPSPPEISQGGQVNNRVNVDPADLFQSFQARINNMNSNELTPSSVKPVSPSLIDTSGRYPYQRIGEDNEELYSQGQGVGSKMVSGIGKGLGLATTTFLQSTVGLVNGVANFAKTGQLSSFYDNDFNRALDDFNKNLENQLPNYYSQAEKNANWYSPDYLLSANFLFDGIIKNMGFAVGAIAAGGVYAGMLKAIPLTAKLFAVGKGAEALAATEEAIAAQKATETFGRLKSLSDKFLSSYNPINPAGRAVVSGLGTIGEASFEALNNLNEYRDKKIAAYEELNGYKPTGDDLEVINKEADSVGNSSLLLNSALLTATQYIQLPKIMGSSYAGEKRLIDQVVSKTKGIVRNEAGEFIQAAPRFGKILGTINKVRPYLFSTSEAFEEGAQYAIQVGTQDYIAKKDKHSDDSILSSILEGVEETLTTNEGQKNILLGGLSGAIMMGRGRYREDKQIANNTRAAIPALNARNISKFTTATLDSVKRGVAIQEDRELATAQGDALESKDLEKDYMINYLSPRIQYDRYDLVQEDLATAKNLASSAEGFAQLQQDGRALATDTPAAFLQRITGLERTAENMHSLFQSINLRYGGLVNEKGEKAFSDDIVAKMVYVATKVADYDERIPSLVAGVANASIDVTSLLDEARAKKYEGFDKATDDILALDILDDKKMDMVTAITDARELVARRDVFLKEYSDLKKNPQKYKDAEPLPVDSNMEPPKNEKITIKTADGDEELETNTEYYLGKVTEYDNKGNEVYRFPRLTILGKNADGTIKVKDAKGNVRDIKESELADYKLGKVADVKGNKKANFYLEHINDVFEYKFKSGVKKGRLQYDSKKNKMFFVYKDAKGKTKTIEVSGQDFVAKKGFKEGLITKIGTLTASQAAARAALASEKDEAGDARRASRLAIIEDLVDTTGKRLSTLATKITTNKENIAKTEKELEELSQKIENSTPTAKGNFKNATKSAIRAASRLSDVKRTLEEENIALEAEKEDLEFNLPYFYDIAQNIDETGIDVESTREELNEQILNLQILEEEVVKSISTIAKLIKSVDGALKTAMDLVEDLMNKFSDKHYKLPGFISFRNISTQFAEFHPTFKDDLNEVNDLIGQIEDVDIIPNKRTLKELNGELSPLMSQLTELQGEIRAKEAILNHFDEFVEREKKTTEEREAFEKNKKLHDELFKSQNVLSADGGDVNTNAPNESIPKDEGGKKKLIRNVASSIEPSLDSDPKGSPERARNWTLLNKIDTLPNRDRIKVITVTANNESDLGLAGLAAYKMGTNPALDADNGLIALVYVEENEDGKTYFIDENGKHLGELKAGEKHDIQKIVYTVAASTAKGDKYNSDKYVGKEGDAGSKEDYLAAWKAKRIELLDLKGGKFRTYDFRTSRGIPLETVVDGKKESNPIVGTLIEETDLDKKGLITIPTVPYITFHDEVINMPLGRPVLTNGSTVQWLNNRNLNDGEADTIFQSIKQLAIRSKETGKLDGRIMSFLQGVMFWKATKNENKGRNQIWVANGNLHMGKNDVVIPFFEGEIEANKEKILAFLKGAYNNVNNAKLKDANFNNPYEEITGYDKDGQIKSIQWKSYQHYLLADKYVLTAEDKSGLNGKARPKESLPLTTSVRKKIEGSDYNYEGKYITLLNNELDVKDTRKKVETPAPKVGATVAKNTVVKETNTTGKQNSSSSNAGNIVLDGVTNNIYVSKLGGARISYTATMGENGEPIINIKKDDFYVQLAAQMDMEGLRSKIAPTMGIVDPRYEKFPDDFALIHLLITMKVRETILTSTTPEAQAAAKITIKETVKETAKPTITDKNKEDLKLLGYTPEQIAELKLEQVQNIIASEVEADDFYGNARQVPQAQALTGGISAEDILNAPTDEEYSDDSANYRRIIDRASEVEVENWEKVLPWIKKVLPNVPVTRLKHLIATTDGGRAWGVFEDAAISIYEGAETGTLYHEAFEAVWNMFATDKEQAAMLAEFRGRTGTFFDRESQRDVAHADATNNQAKEAIAEGFRDYKLNGKIPVKDKSGVSRILKFFADIVSTVKNFLLGGVKVDEFFARIDGGFYANRPVIQGRSTNPSYRIYIINEKTTQEILEAMSTRLVANLFRTNQSLVSLTEGGVSTKELYDAVYKEMEKTYSASGPIAASFRAKIAADPANKADYVAQYQQILNVWNQIQLNWSPLIAANNEFLKAFGLVNEEGTSEDVDDNVENNINNDEKQGRSDDYLRDVMKIDSKKNAAASIRLLFATLIETERAPINGVKDLNAGSKALKLADAKLSSIGQWQMVKYAKAFNHVMHNISNTTSLNDMVKKLAILADKFPNYERLFTRIKGDLAIGQIAYDKLEADDWRLLMKFFNVFAKQKPRSFIQFIDENGNTYTQNANSGDAITSTVNGWVDGIRMLVDTDGKSPIKYNSSLKSFVIDKDVLGKLPISSITDRIKFLKVLGITFTDLEYGALPQQFKDAFNDSVAQMKTLLSKDNQLVTITKNTLGITGALNRLASIKVRAAGDFSESTFRNATGEMVQTFVQNNYPSLFLSDFNSVGSLSELLMKFPQLTDTWSADSWILQAGGKYFNTDGSRTSLPLELGYIDGTVQSGKPGKQTANLSLAQRRLQEINQNVDGRYYVLVPADSKTEWMMDMGNFVSYKEMQQGSGMNKSLNKMLDYLSTEILMGQKGDRGNILNMQGKGNHLRFFKDILSPSLVAEAQKLIDKNATQEQINRFIEKEEVREAIKSFITKESKATVDFLMSHNIITNNEGVWEFGKLDSKFRDANELGKSITPEELVNIMNMRTINYMVANIEMHKIMFGDPTLIKDTLKRIKSFLSGTETMYVGDEFDNFANEEYNKAGELTLTYSDPGYHEYKNYFTTVTLADIISDGDLYKDVNEADAQTWMRDGAYREFLQKHGRWTEGQEEQFQYEMAWTRYNYEGYEYTSPQLEEHDRVLVEKGSPETGVFPVLKPKGSGTKDNKEFIDLYLDKTSAAPLFMRHVQGRNLEIMYRKMLADDIDYAIMESGRKIGTDVRHSIYNADGSFNTDAIPVEETTYIPHRNLGIQVETQGDSHSQTLGSQLTKLATMDLMEGGIPVDFTGTEEEWDALSEEEKNKISPIYVKVQKNQKLLEDLAKEGYERILKKIGVTDNGDSYSVEDRKKIQKFLYDEMTRREVDENTKQSVELNLDTNDFNTPLEASPKYTQIKNILFSIADKYIGSPKVNGGPLIQMSSSMWETKDRTVDEKGKLRTSDELHFPTKEDPYMEILIPYWFKTQLERMGIKGDEAELIRQLNGTGMLNGIGFRIPTQKLSSIDLIRVKGFTPQAMGNTVVVPAQLTKKSGSDFDVDKLNTYLKNIRVDKKGKLSLIEYKGSEQATKDFYAKEFDDALAKRTENTKEFYAALQVALGNSDNEALLAKYQKLLDNVMDDKTEAETEKRLAKYADEAKQDKLRDNYVTEMYRKALENAYFQSLEDILSDERNYDRMMEPNSGGETLKDLRDELRTLTIPEGELNNLNKKDNYSLMLSPNYMSEYRHNFIIGKGGVGIAAVQQTNHSLNQRTKIYVNTDILEKETIQFAGDGKIRLPHNTVSINGKKYASLSGIKDKAKKGGRYISDKISEYIDGFVDIAKDTFIVEIGATPNMASTFMLLEKLGVPTEDVVFFMNQPIIKEFTKNLEEKGWTGLLNDAAALEVTEKFPSTEFEQLSGETLLDTSKFKDNIRKYFKEKKAFTNEENIEQKRILHEFQKYALLASHLFEVTAGSNYDTANFNDSNLWTLKAQQTENARTSNLISSVDKIMENSFIGERARYGVKTRDAIAEAANLSIEKPFIRAILDPIKRIFARKGTFMSEKDKLRIARQIEMSFLDYVIQTKAPLSNHIQEAMLDAENAVAMELDKLKKKLSEKEYSSLANNPILMELRPSPRERRGGPRNIQLVNKDNDVHTSNLYTGALRELRENAITKKLYKRLIAASLLQSGVQKTFYSYGHLIPVEDFSNIVAPLIRNLSTYEDLDAFTKQNAFFRNNWHDAKIVPTMKMHYRTQTNYATQMPEGFMNEYGEIEAEHYSFSYTNVPLALKNLGQTKGAINTNLIVLNPKYNARQINMPVVIVDQNNINPRTSLAYTGRERREMAEKGDFSFKNSYLYTEALDADGMPITFMVDVWSKEENKKVPMEHKLYRQINAWGDGQYAQEYYDRPRASRNGATITHTYASKYINGVEPVETEVTDEQIQKALGIATPTSTIDKLKSSGVIKTKDCK